MHRNGITVDNRKENLTLVPKNKPFVPEKEEKSHKEKREESLYYLAIAQLPADPLQELIVSLFVLLISRFCCLRLQFPC